MTSVVQAVWLPPAHDKWSGGILQHLLDGRLWAVPGIAYRQVRQRAAAAGEPAVVIVPGEEWAARVKIAELNRYITRFSHVVLAVIADEGSSFPWQLVAHPSLRLWIQTPRPGLHPAAEERFYFGFGWHPDTPEQLAGMDRTKRAGWFFAGQITHESRRELADVLRGLPDGELVETAGFAEGLPRSEYLARMAQARAVPCPSGPLTPDSFRLWEALEAGCLPVPDATCPGYPQADEYWPMIGLDAPGVHPAKGWDDFPSYAELAAPAARSCVSAWWQGYKRQLAWRMRDDLLGPAPPSSGITVVISSSVIPSHPSTAVLDETVASIRAQPELVGCDILVMLDDPPRPPAAEGMVEYADACARWDGYVAELVDRCEHDPAWQGVLPCPAGSHQHQANMLRQALQAVRTPLVLFCEHDTPLCGETPFEQLGSVILSGQANVIRLSSEAWILEPWAHLFLDTQAAPQELGGLPLVRTVQWSSRPHLADADWYRRIIDAYFDPASRTFTEEVLHGVVQHAWRTRGEAGWREWRLWMYAPPGDMKRSWHLDGRAGADKGEAGWVFAYPGGGTPPGAPRATAERVPE